MSEIPLQFNCHNVFVAEPANTNLLLANTPVIIIQDVPENSLNLFQVPSTNVTVRNVCILMLNIVKMY